MFNFTKDCFVGVVNVDKNRLDYFAVLHYALKGDTSESSLSKFRTILGKLSIYAKEGFKEEETHMAETGDEELELQIKEHKWFLEELSKFKRKAVRIDEETAKKEIKELIRFMIRWLYSHVVSKDTFISNPNEALQDEPGNAEIEEDDGNPLAFTSKYIIGVESIDAEHKKLFEIIEEAYEVMKNNFIYDKYDKIVAIIGELTEYTKVHFADEEAYMESINYDGLEAQKRAHTKFIEKIESINLEDIDINQDEYLNGLLNFLLDWLVNHILKMDKLIPCHK